MSDRYLGLNPILICITFNKSFFCNFFRLIGSDFPLTREKLSPRIVFGLAYHSCLSPFSLSFSSLYDASCFFYVSIFLALTLLLLVLEICLSLISCCDISISLQLEFLAVILKNLILASCRGIFYGCKPVFLAVILLPSLPFASLSLTFSSLFISLSLSFSRHPCFYCVECTPHPNA